MDELAKNDRSAGTHVLSYLKRNIRTQASDPTIKDLCERIDNGQLKPQADFQRKYVWENNHKIKSRLIESIFMDVPIPAIYTAEEDDGSEVVIDGQQRLLTFHSFCRNKFRLTGLTFHEALNHKSYQALRDIDPALQTKIDKYPLRVIEIKKDSDLSVRFDIFERLNRGSVKLNDQELRNCIFRGKFNDFLKDIAKDKTFQSLLGSKEHERMQDVEYALRFFALYEQKHLKYKPPIRTFINSFMEEYREIGDEKISEYRRVFKQSVNLVSVVFGASAFYLNTYKEMVSGKYKSAINQGLFDVLMYGFTIYDQHQVMPFKDEVKAKLFNLMADDDFVGTISGAGTGTKEKFKKKVEMWLDALEQIIGQPEAEPRFFSVSIKKTIVGQRSCLQYLPAAH
ncbi:MAG: DUF262 domain-containing protein [Syntrophales bacterium]|nr:DUF262 domain-containing protein [Syntrophales bacterium]